MKSLFLVVFFLLLSIAGQAQLENYIVERATAWSTRIQRHTNIDEEKRCDVQWLIEDSMFSRAHLKGNQPDSIIFAEIELESLTNIKDILDEDELIKFNELIDILNMQRAKRKARNKQRRESAKEQK